MNVENFTNKAKDRDTDQDQGQGQAGDHASGTPAAKTPPVDRSSRPSRNPQLKSSLPQGWPQRKGVLPKQAVRTASFGVISLSLFACAALCLLAVWDYTTEGVPWRAVASLGIIAGTMVAFSVVNEVFGEKIDPYAT